MRTSREILNLAQTSKTLRDNMESIGWATKHIVFEVTEKIKKEFICRSYVLNIRLVIKKVCKDPLAILQHCPQLKILRVEISTRKLGEKGFNYLIRDTNLLSDSDLMPLKWLKNLEELYLPDNYDITGSGFKHLTCSKLKVLDLRSWYNLTDEGLEYLGKATTTLEKLKIKGCGTGLELTCNGLRYLKGNINLKELDLRECWSLGNLEEIKKLKCFDDIKIHPPCGYTYQVIKGRCILLDLV